MPHPVLDSTTIATFEARARRIAGNAQRQWGTMTAPAMFAHLTRAIELSLGEVEVPDRSNWLTRSLLRWLVFDSPIPWMRGMKAPAVFFPDTGDDLDRERERFIEALRRFVAAAKASPTRKVASEFFGPMTLAYWGKVNGRHIDHHMRQFGA